MMKFVVPAGGQAWLAKLGGARREAFGIFSGDESVSVAFSGTLMLTQPDSKTAFKTTSAEVAWLFILGAGTCTVAASRRGRAVRCSTDLGRRDDMTAPNAIQHRRCCTMLGGRCRGIHASVQQRPQRSALVGYTPPRRRPIRGPEPLSPAIIFTYQSLKSNERFEANCLRRHGRTRGAQTEWQWPAWGAPQLPACAVRLLSTVCARRFCDQQEMSLHTATGRSLP